MIISNQNEEIDTASTPAAEPTMLERALGGEAAAWRELVSCHEKYLTRVARSYVDSDADDVVQTAWLRLLEQGHTVRDPGAVRTWLVRVVQREAIGVRRRRQREQLGSADADWSEDIVASDPTPEGHVLRRETAHLVHDALGDLSERHETLLNLLAQRDTAYREIGGALSMPVSSIGPTRARALRYLERALAVRGIDAELAFAS